MIAALYVLVLVDVYKRQEWNFKADEKAVETIKEAVRGIRNVRAEMNVSPKKKAQVYVVSEDAEIRDIFEQGKVFFATLGYASEVIIQDNKDGIGDDAVSSVIAGAAVSYTHLCRKLF